MSDYETACPECESIELEYLADGIIHCLACDLEYKPIKSDSKRIPCVQCRTLMKWVGGSHEFGELKLECPECHWTTCITDPKLMSIYKHIKRVESDVE